MHRTGELSAARRTDQSPRHSRQGCSVGSSEKYTGTVVFVSHDRYFIDKLSTRVFEIGDGKVEIYPGNYEDYLWRKQGGAAILETQTANTVGITVTPPNGNQPVLIDVGEPKAKRMNPMKRKQMEDRLHELASDREDRECNCRMRNAIAKLCQRRPDTATGTRTQREQSQFAGLDDRMGRAVGDA